MSLPSTADECYFQFNMLLQRNYPSTREVGMFLSYCNQLEEQEHSKPMLWVGLYIAVASLCCTLAMTADLLHAFRTKKLWFPCKYFTLNAASITVIAVAMKLPVDMNTLMPGNVDQAAKLGSVAFMCTIMANFMPSLASMDVKQLLTNVIGLGIFVITIVVNFCIEIITGDVAADILLTGHFIPAVWNYSVPVGRVIFSVYIVMMLFLLAIFTSFAIGSPTIKRILEVKYQVVHKEASKDQHATAFPVDKLRQHVTRYFVMAQTSSPQFTMISTPLCLAAGVICGISATLLLFTVMGLYHKASYDSDYKWSTILILITQLVGVIVGTIAPILRCFTALNFKWSWSSVFKVEKYWTQKLSDWKQVRIAFLPHGAKSTTLVHNLRNLVLSFCIGIQRVIVVACKVIGLFPKCILIIASYSRRHCWETLKELFCVARVASNSNTVQELNGYVFQLQDEMELAPGTLKRISSSVDRLTQIADKQQPDNLLKLLQKSTGFEGVKNFDTDETPNHLPSEPLNCWSLPVINLTSIAASLPHITNNKVNSLLRGVGEGLFYAGFVEESLNNSDQHVSIRRAARKLWLEVEVHREWLGTTLQKNANKSKRPEEILECFSNKAEKIMVDIKKSTHGQHVETSIDKLIAANSMYRVTHALKLNYHSIMEQISEDQLFELLSSMIADILAACLTNLPRTITMRCYTSVIEKREESIEAATKLLGQGLEIIKKLQERELPSLDPDQMAFIDKWRDHLKSNIP